MATKDTSPIQAVDLPVRLVKIFDKELVLPKDTLSIVSVDHDLRLYYNEGVNRGEATFTITARVDLYHSHFPERMKTVRGLLYSAVGDQSDWFQNRIIQVGQPTQRKWVFRPKTAAAIRRNVKAPQLIHAIQQMFLTGHINQQELAPFLPKKNIFA